MGSTCSPCKLSDHPFDYTVPERLEQLQPDNPIFTFDRNIETESTRSKRLQTINELTKLTFSQYNVENIVNNYSLSKNVALVDLLQDKITCLLEFNNYLQVLFNSLTKKAVTDLIEGPIENKTGVKDRIEGVLVKFLEIHSRLTNEETTENEELAYFIRNSAYYAAHKMIEAKVAL